MTTLNSPIIFIDHDGALQALTRKGALLGVFFFGVFGLWATTVPISGAVVTSGQMVVDHNVRKVQHPTGGVVGELNARDGDFVQAGQIIIRLDETVIRSMLVGVTKKIDELEARAARLNAERAGYAPLKFPNSLADRQKDREVAEILTTERSLYEARSASHNLRKQRLQERVQQLSKEVESLNADLDTKAKLASITSAELSNLRSLSSRKLVTTQRLNAVERDSVNLVGQQVQLAASIAQGKGKIVEAQMQIASLDDELRAETTKELREVQAELAQQHEKKTAAADQLQRIDIRAPISGKVHQSNVHTVGGVVTAAEPIMLIVPTEEKLELEVRVQPQDIDQLYLGQSASVRLNAFNRRTTPDYKATVTRISADVSKDQHSGVLFYSARLALDMNTAAKPHDLKLQSGMQAEAMIRTSDRTMMSYLFKPFFDQMTRAVRER